MRLGVMTLGQPPHSDFRAPFRSALSDAAEARDPTLQVEDPPLVVHLAAGGVIVIAAVGQGKA